jgi:hypothetical protein
MIQFDNEKLRQINLRLYKEFDNINWYYRLSLKQPVIRITSSLNRLGQWDAELREISLSANLLRKPWDIVVEILKHEMAHQYCSEVLRRDDGHGSYFLSACERLGVAGWARRAAVDLDDVGEDCLKAIERRFNDEQSDEDKRIWRRAERLLALSQSSNPHEAALAMQRVRELMTEHAVLASELSGDDQEDYAVIYLKKKRLQRHQLRLAGLLNDFFMVRVIHTQYYDPEIGCELKAFELIGQKAQIAMALHVYHFVQNRLELFWKEYKRGSDRLLGAMQTRRDKESFLAGVLKGFSSKLSRPSTAAASSVHADQSNQAALMKVEAHLEFWQKRRFPRIHNRSFSYSQVDAYAFNAGCEKGRQLNLHRPLSESAKAPLLLR